MSARKDEKTKKELKFFTPSASRQRIPDRPSKKVQQTWEKEVEMDVQYSKYLQAVMLEKLMAKNEKEIEVIVENQLCSLDELVEKKTANIIILKQRIQQVQQLDNDEKIYNELINQLEKINDGLKSKLPVISKINENLTAEINQVEFRNIVLPSTPEEEEAIEATLKKIAELNKHIFESQHPAKSELSAWCFRVKDTFKKRKSTIDKCKQELIPQCTKKVASCISHQYTLDSKGNSS